MTRDPAASLDEIAARWGISARAGDIGAIQSIPDYALALVAPLSEALIAPRLSASFAALRAEHEIEEIYARVVGTPNFEPLCAAHLGCSGQWAAVVRRRHTHADPRIVGIMLAKDESDIVVEAIASLRPALERLYFYAPDAPTRAAIESCGTDWAIFVQIEGAVTDGGRQILLDRARADRGSDPRATWIVSAQGDEIYADDLLLHVRLAQAERASVMTAQVATFVLHESQREGWDWLLPLEQRLTHYLWDFGEHVGFIDRPWIYYRPSEHMRAHPHGLYPAKWATARPVRRHCPFRNPDQARARIEDRLKSGWQPHYTNYADIFMKDEAAGRKVKRYFGWYPEAERVEGIW